MQPYVEHYSKEGSSKKCQLNTYRVKKEFTTSVQNGLITWPVGAIRFWTDEEMDQFCGNIPMFYPGSTAIQFFDEHFEIVEFE